MASPHGAVGASQDDSSQVVVVDDRQADVRPMLTKLPLEVLVRITYFITTSDLANVRLTCRALEGSLFHFFSHEFFRKKQFMVSTKSLQTLIDIANHPTLSPCLKHVIITTDRVMAYGLGGFGIRLLDLSAEKRQHVHAADSDRQALVSTGLMRDMLAEAFGKLSNLETIDLRDFNSRTRNRDGVGTEW